MKKTFLIFSLVLIFCTAKSQNIDYQYKKESIDSSIFRISKLISSDTIYKNLRQMQNFGTRYALAPNRKDIALWLQKQYLSYGFTEVEIDSFKDAPDNYWFVNYDTIWNYNVIAKISGSKNPEDIIVIGGHYDCALNSPYSTYPNYGSVSYGISDNASGTIGVMEIARAIKASDFLPDKTIHFVSFAGEELGFFGSTRYVNRALENKDNITQMINLDMIINCTKNPSNWQVNLISNGTSDDLDYYGSIVSNYTTLNPILKNETATSDQSIFEEKNIPSVFFQEAEFSPYYHTLADSLNSYGYSVNYNAEVAKAAISILVNFSNKPVNRFDIVNKCNSIDLKVTSFSKVYKGYNIYRSVNFDSNFIKINNYLLTDTLYNDFAVERGEKYWYYIKVVDTLLNESFQSVKKNGFLICKDKGILIVDDSEGGLLSPHDSIIDKYYNDLLQGYTITNYQTVAGQSIDLTKLVDYSTIFWHLNFNNYSTSSSALNKSTEHLKFYLDNGGQLLLTTYRPDNYINNNTAEPFCNDYLKIESIVSSSVLRKAIPINNEFPVIEVDSLKLPSNYNGHLKYIKSLIPTPEADTLLVSSTYYANNTTQGQYNGNPVAIGYFGENYKTVTLSFPLYYMDFAQSKVFVDKILHEKFHESVGIKEIEQKEKAGFIMQLYPNPCVNDLYVRYNLEKQSNVSLKIYNSNGINVFETNSQTKSSGEHYQWLHNLNLPEGLYIIILKTNNFVDSQKFIIKK